MTKRFCDKCGKEIPKDSTYVQVFADQNIGSRQVRIGKIEICDDCFKGLSDALKKEDKDA